MRDILCLGCSYTAGGEKGALPRGYPEHINIPGHKTRNCGIYAAGIAQLLDQYNCYELHQTYELACVIIQVPSPTRQPLNLSSEAEWKYNSTLNRMLLPLKQNTIAQIEQVFKAKQHYYDRAIQKLEQLINKIKVPMVFLRYTDRWRRLVWDFSQEFFDVDLVKLTTKHKINYINRPDFNSRSFTPKRWLSDRDHPNEAGARVIADAVMAQIKMVQT